MPAPHLQAGTTTVAGRFLHARSALVTRRELLTCSYNLGGIGLFLYGPSLNFIFLHGGASAGHPQMPPGTPRCPAGAPGMPCWCPTRKKRIHRASAGNPQPPTALPRCPQMPVPHREIGRSFSHVSGELPSWHPLQLHCYMITVQMIRWRLKMLADVVMPSMPANFFNSSGQALGKM